MSKLTLVAKGRADHGQGTNGEGTDLLEGLPSQPSFDLLLPLLACGSIGGILSGRGRILLRHYCNAGPTYYSYKVESISGTTTAFVSDWTGWPKLKKNESRVTARRSNLN